MLMLALLLSGDLPKDVKEAFAKAESFELWSFDPSKGEIEGGFHGWPVLGKTTLKGDEATAVREAVEKGAKESDGARAKCFIPRHGIRLGGLDLVICFECLQAQVWRGEKMTDDFATTSAPAKVLNRTLSDAGVPLPKPPK